MLAFATGTVPRSLFLAAGCREPRSCGPLRAFEGPATFPRRRIVPCASEASPARKLNVDVAPPTTADTFAIDAGRDLFFTGMNVDVALSLITAPLGELASPEDRFIAAERLKFYPSEDSTAAILNFVLSFDASNLDMYVLEERVARRKAVETLGRFKGLYLRDRVCDYLMRCLKDSDPYMVEVAIWALTEIGVDGNDVVLKEIASVLDTDDVSKRVVIQSLMRAGYIEALPRIRECVSSQDPATASAAMTAVCVLVGDRSPMDHIVHVLKSEDLNVRRAALEDITLSRNVSALPDVVTAPNSLVLRARTARVLLEKQHSDGSFSLEEDVAALIDRLIWDHPSDLDLLGKTKDTKKARELSRNIRQLYKNDAVYSYLASRTIAEDHRYDEADAVTAGRAVLQSFTEKPYFDYFGAYHVFKTLGWLRYRPAISVLSDNAANLPPRFFNHQAGAILALAEIGVLSAYPIVAEVASTTNIWELKYACMMAAERMGSDGGALRQAMMEDGDWLIRARARSTLDFSHLRSEFK
jgi:bilin biosynthesis protein